MMKQLFIASLMGMMMVGCDNLPDAQIDAGGVSHDFAKYSAERFKVLSTGDAANMVPKDLKWSDKYYEVHHSQVKWGSSIWKECAKHVSFAANGDIREVHTAMALKDIHEPIKNIYQCASGSWVARMKMPNNKGGLFRVSCRYQSRHHLPQGNANSYNGGILIWFYGHDAAGKEIMTENNRYECWIFPDGWGEWQVSSHVFSVAEGTDTLDLHVRLDGIGDMMFKDFAIEPAQPEKALSVKIMPNGLLDKRYALPLNQAQMLCYGWQKGDPKLNFNAKNFKFTLTLPKGVEYLADHSAIAKTRKIEKLADGSTRISFVPSLEPSWARNPSKGYTSGDKFSFLVKNTNPKPWKGEGTLEVTYEGKKIADVERTEFYTIDTITSKRPKIFKNGMIGYGKMDDFGAEGNREYAKSMVAVGADLLIGNYTTPERRAILREAGISTLLDDSFMSDGYYLGNGRDRPENERFVAEPKINNQWKDMVSKYSTCPLAVINEMPHFKTNIVPRIMKSIEGVDGIWANWEPFMYKGYGCICERCQAAFKEWKKTNPTGTVQKFRSILHGRMVKTLDKYVRAGTGGDKSWGFVAGVSWRETCSAWHEVHPSIESEPIDYAADMKWLEPWGPYCYINPENPYNYEKRGPLAHFIAAKDIRETVNSDFPLPKRPKIMSFPQGMQCGTWFSQPERIAMACDSFFLNGWEANTVYFFPEGYDGRFLKAFADSTTRAAKYEDYVFNGERKDEMTRLEPVKEYAIPCPVVTTYIMKYKNISPLQQVTYDKDGKRMVAVMNFWEKGEAFFMLKTLGLKSGKYDIVDEDGTLWYRGNPSEGVFLMVGAARTKVFEIRKAGEGEAPKAKFTPERLMKYYKFRQADLAKEAAADAKAEGKPVKTDTKAEL